MTSDPRRAAAHRLGRDCRRVIQRLLLQWEVRDCDEEFERIIYEGICQLTAAHDCGDRRETSIALDVDNLRAD